MRRSFLAVCALSLVLAPVAGCAKKDHGGSAASATPTLSAQDRALKYTQCMRDHGIKMDDPRFNGNAIDLGKIQESDQSKIQAADQACQQYKPGRTDGNPPSDKVDLLRQLARCMRDHGVENFPDPDGSGKMPVADSVRDDPQYPAAQSACLKQVGQGGSSS